MKEDHQPDLSEKKSLLKQFIDLLKLGRAPDTTEELESEIQELLEEGEEQGLISSLEERMINSIFNFRATLAAEIMTPAVEIFSLDKQLSFPELINAVNDQGFTRTPIYDENSDKIVGILHVKDLLKACSSQHIEQYDIDAYINPAYFVSETKPIVDLLKEFQKRKIHMAIVNDEFGAVRGLLTLEDILEEIVGEIDDEFDVSEENIETVDDNTIVVQARTDVEVVEDQLGVQLPDGPYESIGGLVIHGLGRIAREGDVLDIEHLHIEVKEATQRQVKSVKITKTAQREEQ